MDGIPKSASSSRLNGIFLALLVSLGLNACSLRVDEVKREDLPSTAPHPAPKPIPRPAPAAPAPMPPQVMPPPPPIPAAPGSPRKNRPPRPLHPATATAGAEAPPAPAGAAPSELDTWLAQVSAPERMLIPGPPQLMRVWIGAPAYKPVPGAGTRSAEVSLPALSHAVKITPIAPGLEISPPESACETIHETGAEKIFTLKASKRGNYTVGAEVALYENPDCTGKRIPKATNTVQVEVTVDVLEEAREAGDVARKDSFDAILALWKEILGILAASLILVFRKRLGQLLGIKQE